MRSDYLLHVRSDGKKGARGPKRGLFSPQAGQGAEPRARHFLAFLLVMTLALAVMVTAVGCGGKKEKKKDDKTVPDTAEPGAPQWTFGSNDVVFRFKADSMLNSYDDQPHTMVVGVYQLSDPNAFKNLSQNNEGLMKLLLCKSFGDSVTLVNKIIIQPGELRTVILDRAKGTQWIGVVAGYFNLKPENAARMYQIPINVVTKGLIFTKKFQLPSKLYVSLFLDPDKIRDDSVNEPPDPGALPSPVKSCTPQAGSASSTGSDDAQKAGKTAVKEGAEETVDKSTSKGS